MPFHQYLKDYYQSRIRDEYHRHYAIAKKNFNDSTKEEKENGSMKKPVALQMRAKGQQFYCRLPFSKIGLRHNAGHHMTCDHL